jgi:hypothetical protein
VVLIGYLVWAGANWGGDRLTALMANLVMGTVAVVFGLVPLVTHRRRRVTGTPTEQAMRRVWLLLGGTALVWAGAQFCLTVRLFRTPEAPFASWIDVWFFVSMALVTVAVLSLPAPAASILQRSRSLLDGSLVALALFGISWVLVLASPLAAADGSTIDKVLLTVYPVGDAINASIMLAMLARSRQRDPAVSLLAFSLVLAAAVDAAALVTWDIHAPRAVEVVLNACWITVFVLLAGASVLPARWSRLPQLSRRRLVTRLSLPDLVAVAALLVIAFSDAGNTRGRTPLLVLTLALVVLVVVRRVVVLVDNTRLQESLTTVTAGVRDLTTDHDVLLRVDLLKQELDALHAMTSAMEDLDHEQLSARALALVTALAAQSGQMCESMVDLRTAARRHTLRLEEVLVLEQRHRTVVRSRGA